MQNRSPKSKKRGAKKRGTRTPIDTSFLNNGAQDAHAYFMSMRVEQPKEQIEDIQDGILNEMHPGMTPNPSELIRLIRVAKS